MNQLLRESWKIAAAFAAGAFLLSLLVGLVTGNPFGTVILRAFLLALLFAVLGGALRWAVRRWLPELAGAAAGDTAGAAPGPVAEDADRGSRVDIVLDDEADPARMPRAGARPAPAADGEEGGGEDAREDAEEAGPDDEDGTRLAEAHALGEIAEELAEELPAARGAEDVDSLPDIGALDEPGPGAKGPARMPRAAAPGPGETPGDAMREAMGRMDPAVLAKGLRTMVKKDENG